MIENVRILGYDFDSGLPENDLLGILFGLNHLGLTGGQEVMGSFGDSGGPTFLNGKIAGVHSFVASVGVCPPDVVTPENLRGAAGCKLDASFGELGGDTRVSAFAAFIDAALVPEPATLGFTGAGIILLVALARRRRSV